MLKEFKKYDSSPEGNMLEYEGVAIDGQRKTTFRYDVGYERFLAPEIFFNPSIYTTQALPLPLHLDPWQRPSRTAEKWPLPRRSTGMLCARPLQGCPTSWMK